MLYFDGRLLNYKKLRDFILQAYDLGELRLLIWEIDGSNADSIYSPRATLNEAVTHTICHFENKGLTATLIERIKVNRSQRDDWKMMFDTRDISLEHSPNTLCFTEERTEWGTKIQSLVRINQVVKIDEYVGREWLDVNIEKILNSSLHSKGVVVLTGESGAGKTAYFAHLVKNYSDFIYIFAEDFSQISDPNLAAKHLAAQLILRFDLDEYYKKSYIENPTSPNFLTDIIYRASSVLPQGQRIVIVCDDIGKAVTGLNGYPFGLPMSLPDGVYLILSRRPDFSVPNFSADVEIIFEDLLLRDSRSIDDMERYLTDLCQKTEIGDILTSKKESTTHFIQTLIEKSAGSWIYLKSLTEEIRRGRRDPSDLSQLPTGIVNYYIDWFYALQKNGFNERWQQIYLPLLATLGVVRQPTEAHLLGTWSGANRSDVERLVDVDWSSFVARIQSTTGNWTYLISHDSLREFIVRESLLAPNTTDRRRDYLFRELNTAVQEAHKRIVNHLFNLVEDPRLLVQNDYARQFLIYHMINGDQVGKCISLIADGEWWREGRKAIEGDYTGYLNDLELLRIRAKSESNMELLFQCSLLESRIRLQGYLFSPLQIYALVDSGEMSPKTAINNIIQLSQDIQRCEALLLLTRKLLPNLQVEALKAVNSIKSDWLRFRATLGIAVELGQPMKRKILAFTLNMVAKFRDETERIQALEKLLPELPDDLLIEANDIIKSQSSKKQISDEMLHLYSYLRLPEDLDISVRVFILQEFLRSIQEITEHNQYPRISQSVVSRIDAVRVQVFLTGWVKNAITQLKDIRPESSFQTSKSLLIARSIEQLFVFTLSLRSNYYKTFLLKVALSLLSTEHAESVLFSEQKSLFDQILYVIAHTAQIEISVPLLIQLIEILPKSIPSAYATKLISLIGDIENGELRFYLLGKILPQLHTDQISETASILTKALISTEFSDYYTLLSTLIKLGEILPVAETLRLWHATDSMVDHTVKFILICNIAQRLPSSVQIQIAERINSPEFLEVDKYIRESAISSLVLSIYGPAKLTVIDGIIQDTRAIHSIPSNPRNERRFLEALIPFLIDEAREYALKKMFQLALINRTSIDNDNEALKKATGYVLAYLPNIFPYRDESLNKPLSQGELDSIVSRLGPIVSKLSDRPEKHREYLHEAIYQVERLWKHDFKLKSRYIKVIISNLLREKLSYREKASTFRVDEYQLVLQSLLDSLPEDRRGEIAENAFKAAVNFSHDERIDVYTTVYGTVSRYLTHGSIDHLLQAISLLGEEQARAAQLSVIANLVSDNLMNYFWKLTNSIMDQQARLCVITAVLPRLPKNLVLEAWHYMKELQQDVVWIHSMAVMAAYLPSELLAEFAELLHSISWWRKREFAKCIGIILRLRQHKDCKNALKRFVTKFSNESLATLFLCVALDYLEQNQIVDILNSLLYNHSLISKTTFAELSLIPLIRQLLMYLDTNAKNNFIASVVENTVLHGFAADWALMWQEILFQVSVDARNRLLGTLMDFLEQTSGYDNEKGKFLEILNPQLTNALVERAWNIVLTMQKSSSYPLLLCQLAPRRGPYKRVAMDIALEAVSRIQHDSSLKVDCLCAIAPGIDDTTFASAYAIAHAEKQFQPTYLYAHAVLIPYAPLDFRSELWVATWNATRTELLGCDRPVFQSVLAACAPRDLFEASHKLSTIVFDEECSCAVAPYIGNSLAFMHSDVSIKPWLAIRLLAPTLNERETVAAWNTVSTIHHEEIGRAQISAMIALLGKLPNVLRSEAHSRVINEIRSSALNDQPTLLVELATQGHEDFRVSAKQLTLEVIDDLRYLSRDMQLNTLADLVVVLSELFGPSSIAVMFNTAKNFL